MAEYSQEFLSPVFEDLKERINLLIRLRWGGISLIILLFFYFYTLKEKGFPYFPIIILIFLTFLFNFAFHLDLRKHRTPKEINYLKRILNLQLYYDIFFYLYIFHFTGGVESPFFILLIFPAISSTLILSPPRNYFRVLLVFSLFLLLLFSEYYWRLNPTFLITISPMEKVFLLLLAFSASLWFSFYLTSTLTQRLHQRLTNLISLQRDLRKNYLETVMALSQAVEAKDPNIKRHLERVIKYATLIGEKLNFKEEDMEALRFGAILHDIGKIGINVDILLKPGRLTPEEFLQIKKHPEIGTEIIKGVEFLKKVEPIILHHHERYDGKGYPEGLKGDEIPLLARVVTIVDSYEAMTSNRPYKKAKSKKEAIEELKKEKGKQFDPNIVDTFLSILEKEE